MIESMERRENVPYKMNTGSHGLLVKDFSLFLQLLSALGSGLQELVVFRADSVARSWVRELATKTHRITELALHDVGNAFPLSAVLVASRSLKRFYLMFDDGVVTTHYLECVASHATQVTVLELHNVIPCDGLADIWKRMHCLEELTLSTKYMSQKALPVGNLYDGISQPQSRLRKLALGALTKHYLSAALDVCKAIGTRLLNFEVEFYPDSLSGANFTKLGAVKDACSQICIQLKCRHEDLLLAMLALRDSLVTIHGTLPFASQPLNGLDDCVTMCTKVRSVTLRLSDALAERFLEVLFSHIGNTIQELCLSVISERPRALAPVHPPYLALVA